MEYYNIYVSDITYLSELTPLFWQVRQYCLPCQKGGVNSHNNLRSLLFRKLCAH